MAGIDSYTTLMLHCNGTDASTSFPDDSDSAHTVTANGNVQVDTAQSKFGGASGLFDGAGDYLSIPSSADWAFGSGDFTVDLWFRAASGAPADYSLIARWEYSTGNYRCWSLAVRSGVLRIEVSSNGQDSGRLLLNGYTSISVNTWYHAALVRDGNMIRMFLDGTQENTGTFSASVYDSGRSVFVGGYNTGNQMTMNGHLDEVRVSKGIARWTSNFTPPASEYHEPILPCEMTTRRAFPVDRAPRAAMVW